MRNAVILNSAVALPTRRVLNTEISQWLGRDISNWLVENVNIQQRYWCASDESTLSLCERVATQLLGESGVSPLDIDLILVATDTPEYLSPATSVVLQHLIGAKNAAAFDLNAACAGFVTALITAANYIRSDTRYNKVLVIGAYAISKFIQLQDVKTATIFADGAGAFLLGVEQGSSSKGFQVGRLTTDGAYYDWLGIYEGAAHMPAPAAQQLRFLHRFPKDFNTNIWTEQILLLCQELNIRPQDVAKFFITQISYYSLCETMKRLALPIERAHTIMQDCGYTGSACIPMAYDDAVRKNLVKPGELVFFIGSGGGLSLASAAFVL